MLLYLYSSFPPTPEPDEFNDQRVAVLALFFCASFAGEIPFPGEGFQVPGGFPNPEKPWLDGPFAFFFLPGKPAWKSPDFLVLFFGVPSTRDPIGRGWGLLKKKGRFPPNGLGAFGTLLMDFLVSHPSDFPFQNLGNFPPDLEIDRETRPLHRYGTCVSRGEFSGFWRLRIGKKRFRCSFGEFPPGWFSVSGSDFKRNSWEPAAQRFPAPGFKGVLGGCFSFLGVFPKKRGHEVQLVGVFVSR
ncbi:MAG: hypothetical protein NCA08_01500 [Deltaproteobacteria bacterium]|nr:hypothetical protein [Candidatus Deferrimicrobium borealis]